MLFRSGPGVLFSSGLIAGGAILGVALAAIQAFHYDAAINVASWAGESVTTLTENPIVAVAMYVLLLGVPIYRVARRPQ